MTTLRDSIARIFARAGWHRIPLDGDDDARRFRIHIADVFWFPLIGADGDVRPPVVVRWDRGSDWEPLQNTAGEWTRHTNHGDVLSSLTHAAERGA